MDDTWRALADPTRRRLIELLRGGPRTTGELCAAFGTSRFAVMKHLRVLERGGLVLVSRDGRRRWNALNHEKLQVVSRRWEPAVEALAPEVSAAAAGHRGGGATEADARATVPAVHTQVFVDAVAWKVFDALTVNVAAWWGPPHLRSADASNLVLEPQPGGRFYEEWGHRQGALRGVVTAIRQDVRLEITGPIVEGPHPCCLAFDLEPREGGTLVTVSSRGVDRAAVDDLFETRLKAFVEKGTRSGIAG